MVPKQKGHYLPIKGELDLVMIQTKITQTHRDGKFKKWVAQ